MNNAPSPPLPVIKPRISKVRQPFAELCEVTIVARSNLPAHSCAEIQLARETCAKTRIVALRAAIAEGRYRVDSEAIANKLVTAIHLHTKSADRRH